ATAALAMKIDCESVAFVADLLNQPQDRRAALEDNRLVFATCPVNDFFLFRDTGQRLIDNIQFIESGLRRVQLSNAAVDKNEVGHRESLVLNPSVPATNHLAHALEIVGKTGK